MGAKVDYTPGEYVAVSILFCGWCNDEFDGPHIGVVDGQVADPDVNHGFGPTPQYYIRQITCPKCKARDLYGDEGGAIYSHVELVAGPADPLELEAA